MEKTFIGVRDVDGETFRKFKALAVQNRMNLGEALTMALKKAILEREVDIKKPIRFKIIPIQIGKKKVRWSEKVDEIVYGEK